MTNTMPMLTDDGQELARKVWEELDRSACPGAFMQIAYEAVMRHYAPPVPALKPHPDELRMDYLVSKAVNVREPLLYGSRDLFWSHELTDEEDYHYASRLREQIDEAISSEDKSLNGVTK